MNSDEALKCLALSKRKFEEGDSAAALRFAAKSLKLNQDNADAKNWVSIFVFLCKDVNRPHIASLKQHTTIRWYS